jgi:hypothetical protein
MTETCLRIVFYQAADTDPAADVEHLLADMIQALQVSAEQPGFQVGYWGRDPQSGLMAAITYWDDIAAIKAAGPTLERLRAQREAAGIHVVRTLNLQLFPASVDGEPGERYVRSVT